MTTNYNYNNSSNVAQRQQEISDLLDRLPKDKRLFEATQIQQSLQLQQEAAADCYEAKLALIVARLKVIVRG